MSTLAVVEEILRETRVPMSVRQIVEYAGDRLPTKSKTPDTVVARDLSMDIKRQGEASVFVRAAPGRYTLRDIHKPDVAAPQPSEPAATDSGTESVALPTAPSQNGSDGAHGLHPANSVADRSTTEPATPVLSSAMKAERAAPLAAAPAGAPHIPPHVQDERTSTNG